MNLCLNALSDATKMLCTVTVTELSEAYI